MLKFNFKIIIFLLVPCVIISSYLITNCDDGCYSYYQQSHILSLTELSYIDRIGRQKYPLSMISDNISIIVVPHSEHCNAQHLSSAAYRMLKKDAIDHVIIIEQLETFTFHGVALPIYQNRNDLFMNCKLDVGYIEQLLLQPLFHYNELAFCTTQSFASQVKFIQYYLHQNVKITPLLIGHITHENSIDIAHQISTLCDDRTLIIISSDVTSYEYIMHYNNGFKTIDVSVYDQDASIIQSLQALPLDASWTSGDCLYRKNAFFILLELLQQTHFKNIRSYLVGYDTSVYRLDNPYQDNIESYAAFIFQQQLDGGYKNYIGSYEQSQLLRIVQNSLQDIFEPVMYEKPYMISYEMMQPHGAFVSLYAMTDHGMLLRGCMGLMQTDVPLYKTIYNMTKSAACHDDRFYPLIYQEIKSTLISISIITDLENIKDFSTMKHTDGIWLTYHNKSVISLPSDHPIHDWNIEETLSDMCFQIGVPLFSWQKSQAKIFKFQSITFQEM